MARAKFDASLKNLSEDYAADWAAVLGAASVRSIRLLDADVSTVTGAADKAMMIDSGGPEWILHPEFVSGHELGLAHKIWWNNSVLHRRHLCLVKSVAVLLRPAADGRHMTGLYELRFPEDAVPYHSFNFKVLRLWQIPVEQLLTGGIGVLPAAPVADDAEGRLEEVVRRIDRRLKAEATPDEADKLRATTTILMGLRHPPDLVRQIMQGAAVMWDKVFEDSSMVQEVFKRGEQAGAEHGAVAQARKGLIRQGRLKFGQPDAATVAAVESIIDLDRLDILSERLLVVNSWTDLLAP